MPKQCHTKSVINQISAYGATNNDTFPTLGQMHYLTLRDPSSSYHSLKLNENSSYLTTFT